MTTHRSSSFGRRLAAPVTRRRFLAGAALAGAAAALPGLLGPSTPRPAGDDLSEWLPAYFYSTRANVIEVGGRRAMLSSHLYQQGTYVRDAFYGPWALDDMALSQEAYAWFAESQLPDGQIRTAVSFDPAANPLDPKDDDSALLFIIWSAVLARRGGAPALDVAARAWEWARARVQAGYYVSPAGPFRYWADTVAPDVPERIAHNQGLYVAALLALRELGVPAGGAHALDLAAARYREFYDPAAGYVTLGKDSRFARCQDVSAVFGEFLCRYVFDQPVLPDAAVLATVSRQLATATVSAERRPGPMGGFAPGEAVGVKVICAAGGEFLPPALFYMPVLNPSGDYQNGGYWPMYTHVALALAERIRPDPARRALAARLVRSELGPERTSKEIVILSPGRAGSSDPARSGYTWNALIPRALAWAGIGSTG